ncbi:MAG: helix-turn-helix domain-containing protein [Candidatus Heteroscillospira sp.]|jgi:transcriptional regulator with XRE-family HTH domain
MYNKHYKMYLQIGLNILYYRKERGLTQAQLAEIANYSRNHIQQIETAATVTSLDALLDIADALGIEPDKLLQKR